MERQSQEYWNDLNLDGHSIQINDENMDSQADELITFSHPRETQNRPKASSFSDLFSLGVSQEIHNNQQVLVRQNSSTTIPTLFPGLPSVGSFLAKAAAEYVEESEIMAVIKEEKSEKEIESNVTQKRKLDQPSPKAQQKKVKREIKTEEGIIENIVIESNLGLSIGHPSTKDET